MKLAVLGSPIAHSKSPALHAAAYRVLGLDWTYEAVEMDGGGLAEFVGSRGAEWRGLSLTMPLKRDILPLLDDVDDVVTLTGGANTVLFDGGLRRGFNTDVFGIVEALRAAGVDSLSTARVLGGGATAASAIVALAQLGARDIHVSVRDPAKAAGLATLGHSLGIDVAVCPLDQDRSGPVREVYLSTLPGHSEHALVFSEAERRGAVLFDVAYDPWPSTLSAAWDEVNGVVVSGLEMLILQALAQVRVFVGGDPTLPLEREPEVLAAMRAAVTN